MTEEERGQGTGNREQGTANSEQGTGSVDAGHDPRTGRPPVSQRGKDTGHEREEPRTTNLPIAASLECLLFVAGEPVPLADLARALERDENETEIALRDLQIHLRERGSGLQLLRIAGGWQFATRPEYAGVVARMLARGANKLSRASMETLAIIAYRQPITAPEIEAVRGVSVSGVLKTLLERRLIAEAGRKAALGRPMLYVTTPDFLHYFAIADLTQLPPLEADAPIPPPVSADTVTDGRGLSGPVQDAPPPLTLSEAPFSED